MTTAVLKIIADAMQEMGIRYGYMEYNAKPIQYPYFVGQYTESAAMNEDGQQDVQFTLTGYSRTTWEALETCKATIEQYFSMISGRTLIATNGNGVAVWYENTLVIPTWDEELKKVQINLHVKEWRVG